MLPVDLTCLQKAIYYEWAPTTQLQSYKHPPCDYSVSSHHALMWLCCKADTK